MGVVLVEPLVDVEIVKLLGPQHAGECLTVYALFVFGEILRSDAIVEFIGVDEPCPEHIVELREWIGNGLCTQSHADDFAASGGDIEDIMRGSFSPGLCRVDGISLSTNHVLMKCVLHVRCGIRLTPEASSIRLVLGEQELTSTFALKRVRTNRRV